MKSIFTNIGIAIAMLTIGTSLKANNDLSCIGKPATGNLAATQWHYYALMSQLTIGYKNFDSILEVDSCLYNNLDEPKRLKMREYLKSKLKLVLPRQNDPYNYFIEDTEFKSIATKKVTVSKKKPNKNKFNKAYVLGKLSTWEGDYLHFNKGEKTYTSPYGIYKYLHKNEPIIKYIDKLVHDGGFKSVTSKNVRSVWKSFTKAQKAKIDTLAYKYHMKNTFGSKFVSMLIVNGYPKTAISLASHITLSGARARVGLLKAVNIDYIGTSENHTTNMIYRGKKVKVLSLKEYLKCIIDSRYSDDKLNKIFAKQMTKYYKYLATNYPKYKKFKKGWLNRTNSLL